MSTVRTRLLSAAAVLLTGAALAVGVPAALADGSPPSPAITVTPSAGLNPDGDTVTVGDLTLDTYFTPGHTPGHVIFHHPESKLAIVGDVLFQGSIGRTDLPGSDHATLLRSIATLLDSYPDETPVHPGHMGVTTLGHERAANPFLHDLAAHR